MSVDILKAEKKETNKEKQQIRAEQKDEFKKQTLKEEPSKVKSKPLKAIQDEAVRKKNQLHSSESILDTSGRKKYADSLRTLGHFKTSTQPSMDLAFEVNTK